MTRYYRRQIAQRIDKDALRLDDCRHCRLNPGESLPKRSLLGHKRSLLLNDHNSSFAEIPARSCAVPSLEVDFTIIVPVETSFRHRGASRALGRPAALLDQLGAIGFGDRAAEGSFLLVSRRFLSKSADSCSIF